MAKYTDFIPQNMALPGIKRIGVYDANGKRLFGIPIGNLLAKTDGEKLYSFGCLSDVHVVLTTGADDFAAALTYLNETEDVEFTCICGDLTQNATADEFAQYKNLVDTYSPNTPVYAIAGNHEAYDGTPVTTAKIYPYTGQPFYYSFTRGEDVFVMCGCYTQNPGNIFTKEELQWLYETLEANRNKRCFVFQHVFPWGDSGNANGAYTYGDLFAGTYGDVFKSLLRHYKNTVFFHGHSHMKFDLQGEDEKANYSEAFGYRSVHIPSLCVPRDIVDGTLTNLYAESEGYVVDVHENGIRLRGRDFVKGEFLPIANYWLDTTLQEVNAGTYEDETGTINTKVLPDGYTLLDYIESSGEQYIITDYFPSNKSRVVADLQFTSTGAQSRVFSAITDAYAFDYYINGSKRLAFNAGTSRDNTATSVSADTKRHRYEIDCHTAKLDGSTLKTLKASVGQCSHSLVLFARRTGGGGTITYLDSPTKARLYSVEIYEEGVLVRNYLPCINSDGEVGLFDRVTKAFHSNVGTGEFVYGYAFVNYIDSDGKAYINTGFIPDGNSKVVMDCQHIGLGSTSAGNTFFGARTSASAKAFSVYFFPSAKGYRYMYGNGYTEKDASRITDRITIIADKNVATIGDKITITRPEQTFACEYPLFLCGMNNAGSMTLPTKLRMYSCQIYDSSGALARDFVPVSTYSGEYGMMDKVNGVFYGNVGTGAFTGS